MGIAYAATLCYTDSTTGASTAIIKATQTGTGDAGSFTINNPASPQSAVYASTNGSGATVWGDNSGTATTSAAGQFTINAPGNPADALCASSNSNSGRACFFHLDNPSNPNAALEGCCNGSGEGMFGFMTGTGYGGYFAVSNTSNSKAAIYATTNSTNINALAGDFHGNVNITGTLFKGGGGFRIDDPIDPANKHLVHSFVESPDMKTIYDGTVTTDGNGFATVGLPGYFQAENRDYRYQLTVIGQFAQAIVQSEVANNSS